MVEPERRRRRPAVYATTPLNDRTVKLIKRRSCTLCRRRKIRCNRETPCSNCIRTKMEACTYSADSRFTPLPLRKIAEPQRTTSHGHGGYSIRNSMAQASDTASPSVVASSHPPCSPVAGSMLVDSPRDSLNSDYVPGQNVEASRRATTQLEEDRLPASAGLTKLPGPSLGIFSTKTVSYLANSHSVHESRFFGSSQVVSRGMMHKSRLFGQSHWSTGIADMVSVYSLHLFMGV